VCVCMMLLLFLVVVVPMDHTDGNMEEQLKATELWSDMIIFSSVTPGKTL